MFFRDVARVVGSKRAPDGEDHASFVGAIHLNAEVALAEPVGHEVRTDRVFSFWHGDLAVGVLDVAILWHLVREMDGRTSAAPIEHVALVRFYEREL